jgi:DNA-binding response OmpR family regulator
MTATVQSDVALLSWPLQHDRRMELRAERHPCLLIVDENVAPPVDTTAFEDWARASADPVEVHARLTALAARAAAVSGTRPWVDASGILHWHESWVALRPIEARLMDQLIQCFGRVIGREELELAGWNEPVGGRALDLQLVRLRRRITCLGLVIRNLRGQGYLLCAGTE